MLESPPDPPFVVLVAVDGAPPDPVSVPEVVAEVPAPVPVLCPALGPPAVAAFVIPWTAEVPWVPAVVAAAFVAPGIPVAVDPTAPESELELGSEPAHAHSWWQAIKAKEKQYLRMDVQGWPNRWPVPSVGQAARRVKQRAGEDAIFVSQ
jgi:hypothetical protein